MSRELSVAVVAACPFPYPRGTPIRIHRLSDSLARMGADVHVVSYHLGEDDPEAAYRLWRIPNIPTYRRLDPGPTYQKLLVVDSILALKLRKLLNRKHFDVIHAHHFEGLIAALLASRNIPIVYDAHTTLKSELHYYPLGIGRILRQRIANCLDGGLPKKADHVFAVTDRIRQRLIQDSQVAPDRVDVVHNGVNMEPFLGIERSPAGSSKTIVFAGNLASYQGIDVLLESFRRVLDVHADARLVIVSNCEFDKYTRLAHNLGVLDRVEVVCAEFGSVPQLLARGEVAVSPRVQCEGVPQKVLNYMAAGLPTVAFEGSAPTLEHGRTGWLVEEGNVESFARGICRLLDDSAEARRMGERAKRVVERRFSWESSAEKALTVYEKLLPCRSVYA